MGERTVPHGNMPIRRLLYKKPTLNIILLVLLICICVVLIGSSMYKRQQQKWERYHSELTQIEASLDRVVNYSQKCIEAEHSDHAEDMDQIIDALTDISMSIDAIYLYCYGGKPYTSKDLYDYYDLLNGNYATLPDSVKLACLQNLMEAVESFSDFFYKEEKLSDVTSFVEATNSFIERLDFSLFDM